MKKIFGIGIAMMLGLFMIGCEEGDIKDTNDQQTKQEQQVEGKEKEETNGEEVENKVLTMQDETFKHYMTTSLTDKEYAEYFTQDKIGTEIEFDGNLVAVDMKEGYDTRVEVLLTTGDYNENEINGPYIKDEDVAIIDLKGNIEVGQNVKIKAKLYNYDTEKGYLEIDIKAVETR